MLGCLYRGEYLVYEFLHIGLHDVQESLDAKHLHCKIKLGFFRKLSVAGCLALFSKGLSCCQLQSLCLVVSLLLGVLLES